MPPRSKRQLLPVTEASTELSYDDVANLGMASPSPNVSRAKKSKVPKKDFLAAEAVVGRTPPKRQRPEDEEEATDAVAVNPTPPHVGRGVVVSGAKKLKTGDESMPSIPKGARVYVREDTQSHVQCAGKRGEVLKPGSNWIKVAIRGGAEDGVSEAILSFRVADLSLLEEGKNKISNSKSAVSSKTAAAVPAEAASSKKKAGEDATKASKVSIVSLSTSSSSSSSSSSVGDSSVGDSRVGDSGGGGGGPVCAYPESSASGLTTSQASRALGRGEGAASGAAAAELMVASAAHEVEHVTTHLASLGDRAAADSAAPLVALLEACVQRAAEAVPRAISEARSRRVLAGAAQKEAKLKQTLASLGRELVAWEAAEEKASALASGDKEGEGAEDDEEGEEGGEGDDAEVDRGEGFELVLGKDLGKRHKRAAEGASLALDELCTLSRAAASSAVAKCAAAGASLASANKAGHFANYIPGDPSGGSVAEASGDSRALLRKMIRESSSSSSSSMSSSSSAQLLPSTKPPRSTNKRN